MCRQSARVLFIRHVCCELPRRCEIIAVFSLQFFTQFCEWNFHDPAREADYDAIWFERLIVAFLYSLPLIVLKSSASAIDADSAAKIASAVLFIAPPLSQSSRVCRS